MEKSFELRDVAAGIERRFNERFADAWVLAVFDDHVIVSADSGYYKAGFDATLTPVPGDPNELEVLDAVTFAPRERWVRVVPTYTAFEVLKQLDGRHRWVTVSSGGFEDRDGEVVSMALLESAIERADATGERGPLLIYHIPGAEIGSCDFQALTGEPGQPGFLLESGLFDDTEAGRAAAKFFAAGGGDTPWGASISFLYGRRTADGVYLPPGAILERSVLPRDAAAFPWSAVGVPKEVESVISGERLAALREILGAEVADQVLAGLGEGADRLKKAGIRWKEVGGPVVETEAGLEPEPESGPEPASEPEAKALEVVLTPEALAGIVRATTEAVLEAVEPTIKTALAGMEKTLAELRRADDEKVAARLKELPRATVRHLVASYRPSQAAPVVETAPEPGAKKSLQDVGIETLRRRKNDEES